MLCNNKYVSFSGIMDISRICKICGKSLLDDTAMFILGKDGSTTVNRCSVRRKSNIITEPGDMLHTKCRKDFTNEIYVRKAEKQAMVQEEADSSDFSQRLRSSMPNFTMKEQCFYCGHVAKIDSKRKPVMFT